MVTGAGKALVHLWFCTVATIIGSESADIGCSCGVFIGGCKLDANGAVPVRVAAEAGVTLHWAGLAVDDLVPPCKTSDD